MKRKLQRFKLDGRSKSIALAILGAFAIGGISLLARSSAATYSKSVEAESGTLAGAAEKASASGASGGYAVKFGGGGGPVTPGSPTVTIDGTQYPNPLTLKNGNAVTSTSVWENTRRAELLADFKQYVYGQPMAAPTTQNFSVAPTDSGNVKRKIVTISVTGPNGSGSFNVKLFIPKSTAKPKGTFVMIDHRGGASDDPNQNGEYIPVQSLNNAGYAIAVFNANDVAPDNNDSYRSKMLNIFYPNLPNNASRAVGAWAWGASRVMDYLQTDPDIDATKVAVIGHSRSGKAALWAGALDTRFAVVISNDSGSTGDKLARRGDGGVGAETVSKINGSFPYWFPDTYKAFNNKEGDLPVDQHELLALIAPRRVVTGSATDDANADPKGEFLAYVAATEVYKLYGLSNNGLGGAGWQPQTNKDYRGDAMSYHLRSGGHGLTSGDWNIYMNGNLFSR